MKTRTYTALAGLTAACLTSSDIHAAGILTIDVSGISTWGFAGDLDNEFLQYYIGPNAVPLEFGWNLNITTIGISWAQEVSMGILDNSIIIQPAAGDAFGVTNQNYQGSMNGLMLTGADGMLNIEFFETDWDDNTNAPDAYFEAGSYIYIIFPSPGPLALFGIGGLVLTRRKR